MEAERIINFLLGCVYKKTLSKKCSASTKGEVLRGDAELRLESIVLGSRPAKLILSSTGVDSFEFSLAGANVRGPMVKYKLW